MFSFLERCIPERSKIQDKLWWISILAKNRCEVKANFYSWSSSYSYFICFADKITAKLKKMNASSKQAFAKLCTNTALKNKEKLYYFTNLTNIFNLFPPSSVLDQLPFMMMSHPLIPASLAPASVSMAMGQMNRLSTLASMANVAQLHAKQPSRAPTSVIKVSREARQHPLGTIHSFISSHWGIEPPPSVFSGTSSCSVAASLDSSRSVCVFPFAPSCELRGDFQVRKGTRNICKFVVMYRSDLRSCTASRSVAGNIISGHRFNDADHCFPNSGPATRDLPTRLRYCLEN